MMSRKYLSLFSRKTKRILLKSSKDVAGRLGFTGEIADVMKKNIVRREHRKGVENIRTFPTPVASSRKRVEGKKSKDQVESFLR
jgi:hypothetical protein